MTIGTSQNQEEGKVEEKEVASVEGQATQEEQKVADGGGEEASSEETSTEETSSEEAK